MEQPRIRAQSAGENEQGTIHQYLPHGNEPGQGVARRRIAHGHGGAIPWDQKLQNSVTHPHFTAAADLVGAAPAGVTEQQVAELSHRISPVGAPRCPQAPPGAPEGMTVKRWSGPMAKAREPLAGHVIATNSTLKGRGQGLEGLGG